MIKSEWTLNPYFVAIVFQCPSGWIWMDFNLNEEINEDWKNILEDEIQENENICLDLGLVILDMVWCNSLSWLKQ